MSNNNEQITGKSLTALSMKEALYPFFKRKKMIALVFLIVMTATILGAYLLPPDYKGTVKIMVRRDSAPSLTYMGSANWNIDRNEVIQTEIGLLTSDAVISTAVEKLGLHNRVPAPTLPRRIKAKIQKTMIDLGLTYETSKKDSWVKWIQKKVDADGAVQSSLIELSLKSDSPKLIAEILDAVSQAYLDQHAKVYQNAGLNAFMKQQMIEKRVELDSLKNLLTQKKDEFSIVNLESQLPEFKSRQSAVSERLAVLNKHLADLKWATKYLEETDPKEMNTSFIRVPTGENFAALRSIHSDIVILEKKRIETITSFSESSSQVAVIEAKVQNSRKNLLKALQFNISQLTSERELNMRDLRNVNAGITNINKQQDVLNSLKLSVEVAERSFIQIQKNYEDSRMNMDGSRQAVNVYIIDGAKVPEAPAKPRLFYLILAFAMAGFMAIALTVALEFTDTTLHTPQEVLNKLQIPVLAIFPQIKNGPRIPVPHSGSYVDK